ncbi:MAG TPA: efflux RND transporter periplasmic adaptor subunit, partial [Vicinamibacteria bacterium]|nr:efflux RND transporter periplasmic adaptor subunit [Vicinamibacteria bacterium]
DKMAGFEETELTDLKGELASLRIDRDRPAASPWRWPLLLFVPVVVILAVLYGVRARDAMSATTVETAPATLTSGGGVAAGGSPVLAASGYLVARRKAVVSAKIQGRLSELRVEEGSRVREGEIIARLESGDYEAQVRRAAAAVEHAQADLAENERQARVARGLNAEKVLAQDSLDAADSRVRLAAASLSQARADLGYAEAQLANTRILAPFTGTVVKKMAEIGESVAPIPAGVNLSTSSGAVVALADLDTLEVEVDVSESNVARLAPDQPAEVTVEAFPDRKYRAVLRQIIPTADRTKATVQVKVTILDKDPQLRPEMSAKVQFLEPEKKDTAVAAVTAPVVSAPASAVVQRDGKPVVFEVVQGHARLRGVVSGPERQGQVVVKEGLQGTETLVVRPPETLKDGDAVRIKG